MPIFEQDDEMTYEEFERQKIDLRNKGRRIQQKKNFRISLGLPEEHPIIERDQQDEEFESGDCWETEIENGDV